MGVRGLVLLCKLGGAPDDLKGAGAQAYLERTRRENDQGGHYGAGEHNHCARRLAPLLRSQAGARPKHTRARPALPSYPPYTKKHVWATRISSVILKPIRASGRLPHGRRA